MIIKTLNIWPSGWDVLSFKKTESYNQNAYEERDKNYFCRNFYSYLSTLDIYDSKRVSSLGLKERVLLGNINSSALILKQYDLKDQKYVFWLMIGAENGNKIIQKQFGEFLKYNTITNEQLEAVFLTRDEKDIRGKFWINKSSNFKLYFKAKNIDHSNNSVYFFTFRKAN